MLAANNGSALFVDREALVYLTGLSPRTIRKHLKPAYYEQRRAFYHAKTAIDVLKCVKTRK